MRCTPSALVTNLIEVVAKAEACTTPCLVHQVELDAIELSTLDVSYLQVAASIVGGKDTLGIRSCETLAPVATETRLRSYLELDIASHLVAWDHDGEDRVLIRISSTVAELIVCIGVIPSVYRTRDIVSFLNDGSVRRSGKCRGARRSDSNTIHFHVSKHLHRNSTCHRATAPERINCALELCRTAKEILVGLDGNLLAAILVGDTGCIGSLSTLRIGNRGTEELHSLIGNRSEVDGCARRYTDADADGLLGTVLEGLCPVFIIFGTACHQQCHTHDR